MKRVLLASSALVLAAFFFVSHLSASQIWLITGSLPDARADHVAFALPDGGVLVAGEGDNGAGPFAPVPSYIYDPATGAWTVGPMPGQPHQGSMSVRLADGRFMIAGGRHGGVSQANVEIFDPATFTWQAASPMNQARVLGTLTLLPNGKVLAAGGWSGGFLSSAEIWDPISNTWSPTASMANARWQHTATLLNNGKVLIAAGERNGASGGDQLNVAEIYDPVSGTWSGAASLTTRRGGPRAAKLPNGSVMVIGGFTGGPGPLVALASTEIYDATTDTWSAGASMATARANRPALVTMPDNTLLMIGGQENFNSPPTVTASVERYDPVANAWSLMPAMNSSRQYHTATLIAGSTEIVVSGGFNGSANVAAAEHLVTVVPTTTAAISPGANGNGWNNTNVTVTLDATVPTGTIASITYSLSGAQGGGATVAADHVAVEISTEGTTTILFHATDNAGNVESDQSLTVNVDKTAPLLNIPNNITAPATVSGGAFVNFFANGSDNGSGVVSTIVGPFLSGQLFPVGTTHETVTVTNAAGLATIGGFDVTVVPGRPFISINGGTFIADGNPHPATVSITQGNGNPVAGTSTVAYVPGGLFAPVQPGQYSASLFFTSNDPAFTNVSTWSTAASDPSARQGATAGVINNKLYVVGGHPFGDPNQDDDELFANNEYDPQTNTWTPRTAPPFGRNLTGGDVWNNKLYVAGGCINSDCNLMTNAFASYDPAVNSWSTLQPMPQPRNLMAVGAINARLYVAGGAAPFAPTNSLQVYDIASNTWAAMAAMPQPSHSSAAVVFSGTLFVMGGVDASGPTTRVQVYDPGSNSWSTRAPMLTTQTTASAVVINNRIYLFGGSDGFGTSIKTVQSYDPNTNTWSFEAPLGVQRYSNVTGAINGRAYITGGATAVGVVTGITEVFDPSLTTHITILQGDLTPPISNLNAPFPNGNGWFNSDVNVSINAFDAGNPQTGVQSVTYSLSGATTAGATVNGNGTLFTITNEGETTVTYHATDNAGNVETDKTFIVRIDKTRPTATLSLGSAPNANGWHNVSPHVFINTSDTGSQVNSISYTLTGAQNVDSNPFLTSTDFNIFNQGETQIAYHATDKAGNSSLDQFFTVRYDNQQPMIDFIANISATATSAGGAVVNFATPTASDSTSGIDTITTSPASGSTFPHGSTSVTATATDRAGNVATRNFTVTVNKALVSINVLPNTATINQGQSQMFQAQGVFTDNSTAILPTGGGGGSGTPQNTGTIWNVHFDDALNLSQCGSAASFSSQAIGGSSALPANIDSLWGPTNSVVHATGTVTATHVSLTLVCVNGQGTAGTLSADWTGTRYEGSWNFSNAIGNVTVRGWSPKAPAPSARFSIGAVTVNGKIYVMGNGDPSQPSPIEVYDIANDSWTTEGAMPMSREGAAYAVLNGEIYAAGGHVAGGNATNSVDVYDIGSKTWSSLPIGMTMPRAQFALVAASDGKLYAIGGETGANGSPSTSSMESYDPASQTWSLEAAAMSSPRRFHVAGALNGGSLIVVAGGNQGGSSTTEVYNFSTHSWSPGPAPQSMIDGARAVVINNAMFVVGGSANGGSNRVQMFRPANGPNPAGWAVPGDMPTGRGQLAVAAADGGSDVLYAIGGLRNSVAVSTVEAMSTPPPTDLSVSAGGGGGGGGGFTLPNATFSSTNTTVATITSGGQAFGNQAGQTTIVATANGISSQTTGTSATLTVVDPDCASVLLTITPVGSLPFSTLTGFVEGEGDSFEAQFGLNPIQTEPGTFILHFTPPAGYTATPNPLTVVASCAAPASYEVIVEAIDHTPPVLTLPANIVTFATSPLGANVSFTATAMDAIDGPRAVSCVPASGSFFPIGETTVHCSAGDTRDNTANGSFTVTVLSASEIVTGLIDDIEDFPQANNLLNNVLKSITNGNTSSACSQLSAFISQVQAQAGKKLTQAEATQLIEVATAARAAIGCGSSQ